MENWMKLGNKFQSIISFQVVLLIAISAIIYLPFVGKFNFYRDDWYYFMDAHVGGSKIFQEMFKYDRPARGYFFETYYTIFGDNHLPYHLGQYIWHVAAALAALWLFRMLWTRQPSSIQFYMALLFLIYPGYISWIAGIEYQPMMVSLFLEVFSIALTIKAIRVTNIWAKITLYVASILTGWGYLLLVEYAIGMEAFRLFCIFILASRSTALSLPKKLGFTLKNWLYTAIIPIGFLIWRFVIFENTRKATDLSFQISNFLDSPRQVLQYWFNNFFYSVFNVSISAWISPFDWQFFGLESKDKYLGIFLTIVIFILLFMLFISQKKKADNFQEKWKFEAVAFGFSSILIGLLPVIITNRVVQFADFSYYSLPVSLASAMFITGFVSFLSSRWIKQVAFFLLVGFASLSHYALAVNTVREANTISQFWWQMYWRAPGIQAGTTLAIYYPNMAIREDFDNIWGPANLIYFPDHREEDDVLDFSLSGMSLTSQDVERVLAGEPPQRWRYRTHAMLRDFSNILVISQSSKNSCVQVFDNKWLIYSSNENSQIVKIAPYSKVKNITFNQSTPILPQFIFGNEPEHTWCYYYEKAELAIQQGLWVQAANLGDEVIEQGLSAPDPMAWIPFLKAYALTNNGEKIQFVAKKVKNENLLNVKVCNMFRDHTDSKVQLEPEMEILIDSLFCPG